jgi:hypothetical protein
MRTFSGFKFDVDAAQGFWGYEWCDSLQNEK